MTLHLSSVHEIPPGTSVRFWLNVPCGGLFVPDANGINLADSQSDLGQSRSGSVMDRDPSKENGHQQDVEEDMIEVKF